MSWKSERGAAAVEFALLAPVLIMLVLGIMEFSRAYNVQVSLSAAAREGVRVMAINNDAAAARTAVKSAATGLQPVLADTDITVAPASCTAGATATVTITYTLSTLTGIAGPFPLEGKGVMLCGG